MVIGRYILLCIYLFVFLNYLATKPIDGNIKEKSGFQIVDEAVFPEERNREIQYGNIKRSRARERQVDQS